MIIFFEIFWGMPNNLIWSSFKNVLSMFDKNGHSLAEFSIPNMSTGLSLLFWPNLYPSHLLDQLINENGGLKSPVKRVNLSAFLYCPSCMIFSETICIVLELLYIQWIEPSINIKWSLVMFFALKVLDLILIYLLQLAF